MINTVAITNSKLNQYRLRVRYRKDGRLAHLGHLEVINTINRSVRRSQLPLRLATASRVACACSSRRPFPWGRVDGGSTSTSS